MTALERLRRLAGTRRGRLGTVLLPLVWVLLGALVVLYVAAMLALAFAAVVVHTLRLVLAPPLAGLARLTALPRHGQ